MEPSSQTEQLPDVFNLTEQIERRRIMANKSATESKRLADEATRLTHEADVLEQILLAGYTVAKPLAQAPAGG